MTQPDSGESKKIEASGKRPRHWRRRGVIVLIALLGLAVIFRIALVLLLPAVMNKVARTYKLQCHYDRLDLSLTGGNAAMWGFQLFPREGGDPVLRADYLQGNISVLALFRGRLVVYRAAADGVDATFEREADGHIPLLDRFASSGSSAPPPKAPSTANASAPLDLEPPLRIDALRLEHVRARVRDLCVNPPIDAGLALDFRLSNLGTPKEPTRFELDFSSDPMLDSLLIEGRANGDAKQLTANLHVLMRGLHLKPAQGYLSAIGLRAVADDISAMATGQLTASVGANPGDGIKANLTFDNARLTSDGKEAAALDELELGVDSLNPGLVKLGRLAIKGIRCDAGRNADGSLAIAGVEIVKAAASAAGPKDSREPIASPTSPAATSGFRWSLDQFTLTGMHVGFLDQSVSPPATLALDSRDIELDKLDSGHPDSPANFSATLTAPGIVREIHIAGHATPFAATKSFNLTVAADGIAPSAADPYLNAARLASEWKDGSFSASADGEMALGDDGAVTANARLADVRLADGSELFAFKQARIKGMGVDPHTRTLRVDAIDISGPSFAAHRDAEGNLHVFAFKTKPASGSAAVSTVQAHPAANEVAEQTPSVFENFEIGHFAWKDVHVSLTDDTVNPPAALSISDAGITVDDLSIHLKPTGAAPKPGKIRAWLVAPNLASRLSFEGIVTPAPDQTNCDFNIRGEGLRRDAAAAYLKPLGIEPTLTDGSVAVHGKVKLDQTGDRPRLSLALDNLKYNDADQSLASVAGIHVDGLSAGPGKITLDSINVESPHARVVRRFDGGVETAGLHFIAKPPAQATAPVADPPADRPSAAPPAAFSAAVKSLTVSDVGIDWIDRAVQPNVQTTIHAQTELSDFEFSDHPHPGAFHAIASVDRCLDALTVVGTLAISPTGQNVRLTFDVKGLRAGPMAAYLPRKVRSTLQDGSLHLAVAGDVSQNRLGGEAIELGVHDFSYRDSGDVPLLQFDSFHLEAPRLDPAAKVVSLDDVTLDGLETNVRKTATGMDLLGLELVAEPRSATATTEQSPAPPPSVPAPVTAASQPSDKDILRQIAANRGKSPLVKLQKLDLITRKITVLDETNPGATPLVVSNLEIRNIKSIALLGRDPESNPPTEIQITGGIDPVADQFAVDVKATPFSRQKAFGVDLTVSGIHGAGLTAVAPQLAAKIDGRGMTNGQFQASLLATLKLQTHLPSDFDFSHGGKLDFSLTKTAFRDQPGGPVLAGVGEIHSDGIVLSPNLSGVEFKELEIDNLTARAERKHDGLHVLGLVVKTPTTRPSTAPTAQATAQSSPAIAVDPPPSGAIKIDRLLVSGIDCRVEDQTCDPPAIIPINGLDVEVQNLSSQPKLDDKPVRFNLLASADKVPLPGREPSEDASRELFSQIAGSGVVSLCPNLKGWTKLSLSGFELLGVRGLAHEEKITVGGGTFDGDVDLRFPGDGTVDTSTRLVLTDLSLSEPPNGFISHTLRLPAPLDVVIAALQDQDGSITIPLNVSVERGQLNTASVVGAGVGALAEIITTAVASAPLKLAGSLLGGKQSDAEPPIKVSFPAAYSDLGPDQIAQLEALAVRLQKKDSLRVTLRSDAGRDDVWLAGRRVNPGVENAVVLADALARRRDALLAARLDATSQVRALLASTDTDDAARAIERLRTINRQLAYTENAMDYAYDLLRPGADRQAMRRTRAATLAIARARIETIREFLIGSGRRAIDPSRISQANPQFVESPENQDGKVMVTTVKGK
ncbi:MAG: DUF748 domain-containing protein [Tepidisphaeraceae bacterium]